MKDLPSKKYCEVIMFKKDDKEKRFIKILKESSVTQTIEIILDTETGVNYMYVTGGSGKTITPLLGPDGKVLVSNQREIESYKERA